MSFTDSQRTIKARKYDQKRIKGKKPVKSNFVPDGWLNTKYLHNGNLYEQIGVHWYLMKENFYDKRRL